MPPPPFNRDDPGSGEQPSPGGPGEPPKGGGGGGVPAPDLPVYTEPGPIFKPTPQPPEPAPPRRRSVPEPPPGSRPPGSGRGVGDRPIIPRPPIDTPEIPNVPPSAPTRLTYRAPRELTLNQSAAGTERDIILGGPVLQGAKYLYTRAHAGGQYLYIVVPHGEGPIQRIKPCYDGLAMTLVGGSQTNPDGATWTGNGGYVVVWCYDGHRTNFQEMASGLFGYDPTWITSGIASKYNNLAFSVVRIDFDPFFSTTIPTLTFDIDGYADVLDTRTGLRGYTDNWALTIREALTNTRWGYKHPLAGVGDWIEAANDCDGAVFPARSGVAPSLALGAAGAVPAGTWEYTYTRHNSTGVETLESPLATIVTTGQRVLVTITIGDANTSGFRVYRRLSGTGVSRRRVGTLAGNAGGVVTDNTDAATWAAAAAAPAVAPTSPKRYYGGMIISKASPGDAQLITMAAHCLGVILPEQGVLQLRINKALPPGYLRQQFSEFHSAGGTVKPNVDAESIFFDRKVRADLFNEVEVVGTDAQNGYQKLSVVKQRPDVIAGTSIPRRATYYLPGLLDSAIVGRVAISLLNLAWDDAQFTWDADRSAISTAIWDVVTLNFGTYIQDVRVRVKRGKGEGYTLSGTEYQDGSFSDVVQAVDAPIVSGGANPASAFYDTPPDITAPTFTEEPYQDSTLVWRTRGVVTLTIPTTTAFFEAVEAYVSINGGPQRLWFEFATVPTHTPPLTELGSYSITYKVRTFAKRRSAGYVHAVTVLGLPGKPPEIVDPHLAISLGAPPATLDFGAPVARSVTLYATGFWTATNLAAYNGTKVSDGDTATAAFNWNVAGASKLVWTTGGATGPRECWLYTSAYASDPLFGYADGGATTYFTASLGTTVSLGGGITLRKFYFPSGLGNHLSWSIEKASAGAEATTVTEVSIVLYGAAYAYLKGYLILDNSGRVFETLEAGRRPTLTAPLVIEQITSRSYNSQAKGGTNYSASATVTVRTISFSDEVSDGVAVNLAQSVLPSSGAFGAYVEQSSSGTVLVNGLNSSINGVAGLQEISGPTGAFLVGGFSGPLGGAVIRLTYAGAQAWTLVNEDASSFVAYRIKIRSAANVTGTGPFNAWLEYNNADARWVLLWWQVGTLYAPLASPAFTGTPTAPTPAAGTNTTVLATAAFVQLEGLQRVSSLPAATVAGNVAVAARPTGAVIFSGATASGTYVTILNVSGKGALRYLAAYSSAGIGASLVQITIDGGVVGARPPGVSGDRVTHLGGLVSAYNSNTSLYDLAPIPEGGFTFKTSLLIELKANGVGGTSTVEYSYLVY